MQNSIRRLDIMETNNRAYTDYEYRNIKQRERQVIAQMLDELKNSKDRNTDLSSLIRRYPSGEYSRTLTVSEHPCWLSVLRENISVSSDVTHPNGANHISRS